MPRVESRLITQRMPWHANMTERNHLGQALLLKPHVMEGVMTELFTAKRYSSNPLTSVLSKMGKIEDINGTEWEWQLKGATTRPLICLENVEPSANTTPGKGRQFFKLKLDEPWYKPGDVLTPGTSDKRFQARVAEGPVRQGTGWVYVMRMMSDDFTAFMPVKYLTQGQQWGKLYSQYGEASEQSGSTQYSGPMSLKNHSSLYRKEYQVTGGAADEVLSVKVLGSDGKYYTSWVKYAEVEYWEQWYRELERGYWYSRSTSTVLDANGRPVLSGPGIQEQLEDGHNYTYSFLTARLIEEYLMDIFYGRVRPGKDRIIKGFTGEYGMIQFHRAVQDWAKKSGFIQIVDNTFVQKTSSEYNQNALVAGYQYTRYRMANGCELELVHNPLYDDRELNMEIDPITGYPIESQRITFLDFSNEEVGGNLKLVNKKGSFKHGYVAGLTNPYGPNNGKLMSHNGDFYDMTVQKESGAHIHDVTKCGELILGRN